MSDGHPHAHSSPGHLGSGVMIGVVITGLTAYGVASLSNQTKVLTTQKELVEKAIGEFRSEAQKQAVQLRKNERVGMENRGIARLIARKSGVTEAQLNEAIRAADRAIGVPVPPAPPTPEAEP